MGNVGGKSYVFFLRSPWDLLWFKILCVHKSPWQSNVQCRIAAKRKVFWGRYNWWSSWRWVL